VIIYFVHSFVLHHFIIFRFLQGQVIHLNRKSSILLFMFSKLFIFYLFLLRIYLSSSSKELFKQAKIWEDDDVKGGRSGLGWGDEMRRISRSLGSQAAASLLATRSRRKDGRQAWYSQAFACGSFLFASSFFHDSLSSLFCMCLTCIASYLNL